MPKPPKTSARAAIRAAKSQDAQARIPHKARSISSPVGDSFINFAYKLGVGADNPLSFSTYGYNPITRNRMLLEWIHRGSWLGGVAIDLVADDMTRAGIDFLADMNPDDEERLTRAVTDLGIWASATECVQWSRLYGGCIGVLLVDGQDMRTPLRPETVGKGQFRGIAVLDRWMVDPSLEDLVTELGPDFGLPRYYRVLDNAPGLRGQAVHHTRCAFRLDGVRVPYNQRLTENLWGISVLERLYDRMLAFDSASTGAAQLVFKSHLRTLKVKDLRQVVAAGGVPMQGLMGYIETMRRWQGIEGMSVIDSEDEFETQQTSAMTGIEPALNQFAQQLSGALQIPLTRLFGQAPGGLSTDDASGMRTYFDMIRSQQNRTLRRGIMTSYRLSAQSEGIKLPDNFGFEFASLEQLNDVKKAEHANTITTAVSKAFGDGIIGRKTALMELRQSSQTSGVYTNISNEQIEEADDDVLPPLGELEAQQEHEVNMHGIKAATAEEQAQAAHDRSEESAEAESQRERRRAKLAGKG